ncbi:HPr family phosphocarrier protein [Allokutzneria sp. NRRL B-24872]|uniref:HPr family phosphocarrier protein n=1 Tax=Allokutzneria sp. NRRL B-24872 TaxID=1137961 RepID=UPI000A3AD1EA|nr:HPr family phosphocarrier protein [Allokutzneria sp. NRRL B-24872]
MPERRVTVASSVGLHARPAALLAKAAAAQPVTVAIRKDGGEPVEAASVLGLMTLGAMHGDEVVLSAEGEGAEAALEALASIIAKDLDHS